MMSASAVPSRQPCKKTSPTSKRTPEARITIEGNCDERGTEEYNLALGQRRAEVVKEALTAQGIPADRLNTISYGKDRPFVVGHNEDARRMNRRAHFASAGPSVASGPPQ